MLVRQRSRLLGSGILVLLAGTLILAACNSSSVSGTQPKPSTSTNAEAKAAPKAGVAQSKGLIDAALEQVK
jgi:uncharacterized lipoprotein YajG